MMGRWGPPFLLPRIEAALPMSLEQAASDHIFLADYTLEWTVRDSDCDPHTSLANFVKLVQEDKVDVVIGPGG